LGYQAMANAINLTLFEGTPPLTKKN